MVLRTDRSDRSGADPTLNARILLFCFGAGCAVAGIWANIGWLITLGIVVLAAGVLLRLITERQRREARYAELAARAEEEDAEHEAHEAHQDDCDRPGSDTDTSAPPPLDDDRARRGDR
jgi:hypothetical protein